MIAVESKNKRPTVIEAINRGFHAVNGAVDILFIFPPATISDRYGKGSVGDAGGDLPPLGITCMAGFLRERGFGVGILDGCALRLSHDQVLEVIKDKAPRVIGISLTTYAIPAGLDLARRIRQAFPDMLLALGGAHANAVKEQAAKDLPPVDLVVYGEGEYSTLEILEAYRTKGFDRKAFLADDDKLKTIQGIVYRVGDAAIKTLPRPDIEDLDSLPLPARDLLPMEWYLPLPNQYHRVPVIHMVVIRGCPYACSFCDQARTGGRMRSPQKTVEEVRHLVEQYGAREIAFWDDTMSFNKRWMREFCNQLIEAKLDVIWSCYAAVNTVDKPQLELMKKAGCWNIFYGYETHVPELMKNMAIDRKNTSADRIRQVTQWTKEAGIEIRGSFMLAIPGETPAMAEETIRFAIELDPEYAQFSITTPYPGTQLYDEIQAGKWGKMTTNDFSQFQGWNVVFLPEGYKDKEEVWAMEQKAFRSFYFRPRYIIKKFLAIRSWEDIKRYYKGLRLLVGGFAFGPMPEHVKSAAERA